MKEFLPSMRLCRDRDEGAKTVHSMIERFSQLITAHEKAGRALDGKRVGTQEQLDASDVYERITLSLADFVTLNREVFAVGLAHVYVYMPEILSDWRDVT